MRWLPFFLLCLKFLTASAQDATVEGNVYSGSYLKPLQKVKVRMGLRSTKTDFNGHFSIPLTEGAALTFYHSKYDTYALPFDRILTNKLNKIYLIPTSNLYSMILEGEGVEEVRSTDYENIFDYTFLSDTLVVLSYLNQLALKSKPKSGTYPNCAMTLIRRGSVIDRKIVPDKVIQIHKDPFNRLFLELLDTCYQVIRAPGTIQIKGFSFLEYYNQILPIEGVSTQSVFFIKYYSFLPVRLLRYFDPATTETFTIYTARNLNYFAKVDDDLAMLSPGDIEVAKKLATNSGIDYSFYSTYVRSFYIERDITKPRVQGFMIGDIFYFFDFQNDIMLTISADGKIVKTNNTIYLDELSRENFINIIQDPFTEALYTLHEKAGVEYIRKVDTETGSAGQPFKLYHAFAKNVKIFEGYVYYIHQTPVTDTKSELLRQKLPF